MNRPSRDPGPAIKQHLRREVNYGCPVRYNDMTGCGCPILAFHHFDPPWAGNYVHNLEGMVALCPNHHNQADGGNWSNKQLRQFKKTPFVDDALKVQWPWQPETLVIKVGSSLVMGSGSPFRLDGIPVLQFYPDNIENLGIQTVTFNSDIRDSNKKRWLKITDSFFDLRLLNTTEVIFTPQTKTFTARHDDNTYISLRYKKYSLQEFKDWIPSFITKKDTLISVPKSLETTGAIDSDGNVPVILFEGDFRTRKIAVNVKGNKMHFECFIPGLQESFNWHSWIVGGENRAILRLKNNEMGKGQEFFSLG